MYHGICMCNNTLLKYSDGQWCCKSTTEQCLIDDQDNARQFISSKFSNKIPIKNKGLLMLCIRFYNRFFERSSTNTIWLMSAEVT